MDVRCSRPELKPCGDRFWHCVQLYEQPAFLAETVARFAAEGLAAREAVILLAKDLHRPLFEAQIASLGVDLPAACASGQLTILSAEDTLTRFMGEGWPNQEAFHESMGGMVRAAAAGWAGVRAFGEMVAVLWDAGHPTMALRIEELLDELAAKENFSLLCAYALSSFEAGSQSQGFLGVCDSHSLVLPSESYLALACDEDRLRAVAKLQQIAAYSANPARGASVSLELLAAQQLLKEASRRGNRSSLIAVMMCGVENSEMPDSARLPEWGSGIRVLQIGAAESVFIAEGLPDLATAHELAQTVHRCLPATACLGVDISTAQNTVPHELLQNAEVAFRQAQRGGQGQLEFYSSRVGKSAHVHVHLEKALRTALDQHELEIYYQPEISLLALETCRFEALLRWFPSRDCSVPPSAFIPVAEASGLIVGIGEWVLRQACRRAAEWQRSGFAGVGVAVNVSAVQFAEPHFVTLVASALNAAGLNPSLLELELTETVLIRDFEQSIGTLKQLRSLGVTVAIDDFGTGYSSLGYLQRLPIDALKIDKCFLSGLDELHTRAPVLRGMIGIARELGVRVVAEGIETPVQFHAISGLGCDEAQGFLLGRPAAQPQLWSRPLRRGAELAA